ncbi:hypothetical protein BKA70DRAFT_1565918 [Coprinopsis sp. MPI-PUGE-AT-0042]|nr:hypothetical protein BKA70DRAFT_1565918 [Coprinopsis sp. MPI-PUGE-AT-0042]
MEIGTRQHFFARVVTEMFFMGFFTCLVLPCTLALVTTRARVPALLKIALAAIFLSSIATIAVDILVYLKYYDQGVNSYPTPLYRPRVALRICNSALSQSVVTMRCIQLWRNNRYVVLVNALLLLATIVTGFYGLTRKSNTIRYYVDIYYWTSMTATGLLSAIIIVRTCWMRRQIYRQYSVTYNIYPKFNMLVDAGIGYPLIAFIDRFIPVTALRASFVPLAGITCGLIVLQTALGRNSRDIAEVIMEAERAGTPILDTLCGSMGPSLPALNPSMVSQISQGAHLQVQGDSRSPRSPAQPERKASILSTINPNTAV